MFHIVLHQPEIPPNTGNIMRLCANTGCALHLIEPLGFSLDEKALRRAGLDYRDTAEVCTHATLDDCLNRLGRRSWSGNQTRSANPIAGDSESGLPQTTVTRHTDQHANVQPDGGFYAFSTRGTVQYHQIAYQPGDILMFGSETRGLPADVRNRGDLSALVTVPMQADSRSLNLSNTVAIVAYEAWRQNRFDGQAW